MDNWNGMTEPLKVGDPVRIVKANFVDHIGIVTKVVDIAEAGRTVNVLRTGITKRLNARAYVVETPKDNAFGRTCLYKLPPDFFKSLDKSSAVDDSPLAEYANRKRLQKTES